MENPNETSPIRGCRVLVVDDDADLREFVATLFELRAAHCSHAEDGTEALERLSVGTFDLVVTDVRMPSPTGIQLVAMARTAGCAAPFLVVTAFPDAAVCVSVDRLDATALVAKPFLPEDIISGAERLIRARSRLLH